jgi:hypothetical protein
MTQPTVKKINLVIHQDWSEVMFVNQSIRERVSSGQLPDPVWVEEYGDYKYNFGNFGAIQFLDGLADHTTPKYSTSMFYGKMVESMLPWTKEIRNTFKELNIAGFTYYETAGNISPHIDGQINGQAEQGHCRLNYIINDTDAVTYVDNNGNIESHGSESGSAWLIDTTKLHWVKNNQERQVFQITFHDPFKRVSDYLSGYPKLEFGTV